MQIDDKVKLESDGKTSCVHCGAVLGLSSGDPLERALKIERDSQDAGPSVHVPAAIFVDRPVVLHHRVCPKCGTLLLTEIVPADEQSFRSWRVKA